MEIQNKVPKQGTFTPAHQDNFYFQLSPPSSLTAYIPLEMHNAKVNGGLKFLKGTNKLGTLNHKSSTVKAFSSLLELENPEDYEEYNSDLVAVYIFILLVYSDHIPSYNLLLIIKIL